MAEVKSAWPPVPWLWDTYRENGAWYWGDPFQLALNTKGFWKTDAKHKIHVPIAADLSALAAGFVFSGSPTIVSEDEKTNKRLQEILQDAGMYQLLIKAAEMQSAYGGVFLKLNWSESLVKRPIIDAVSGDNGNPTFSNGILTKCVIWSIARRESNEGVVYRLQETYTRDGRILSELYKGTLDDLGTIQSLDSIQETAGIKPVTESGTGLMLATYVPNRMPNKYSPNGWYGGSDYEGLHGLFSALDQAYTSLNRDIRLSQTRVIVPLEFLRRKQIIRDTMDGQSDLEFVYSSGDEIYAAMDINPEDSGAGITTVQPDIRAEKLLMTVNDLIRRAYMMAGFSPQSAGIDISGSAESGTALNVRERRSLQTAEVKKTYWWHALIEMTKAMIALDKSIFHSAVNPEAPITVSFADNTQPDMQTVADTVQRMSAAGAASTKTLVKLLHPDWNEDEVDEEVALIAEEKAMSATAYSTPIGSVTDDDGDEG